MNSKQKRRAKRQAKLLLWREQREERLLFLWEQFLGVQTPKEDKTYYPEKDPAVSNHRRVIGQRIQSGRIKLNVNV